MSRTSPQLIVCFNPKRTSIELYQKELAPTGCQSAWRELRAYRRDVGIDQKARLAGGMVQGHALRRQTLAEVD
jgi:hypothetical protein